MRRNPSRIFIFSMMFLNLLFARQVLGFSQPAASGNEGETIQILKRNSEMLRTLESKFERIYENHQKMTAGINYLRVRNHKKGRMRLTSEQQKMDVIALDSDNDRKVRNFKEINDLLDERIRNLEGQ